MFVIALTIVVTVVSVAVKFFVGIGTIKAFALFFGLEGTALLALAFSPDRDEMKVARPKGILKALLWPFTEGRSLNYPINYNPVFFYGGLVGLAVSMVLSTIPAA